MTTLNLSKYCCTGLFLSIPFSSAFANNEQKSNEKPNIVFIFADDLTIDALGFTNNELITPNLDKLRSEGAYFSHVFNQGAWGGAVSIASRSMLVTGKYLWKASKYTKANSFFVNSGWPTGYKPEQTPVKCAEKHWSEYMKDAGYSTYMTGKWHISTKKPEQIFDHVVHVRPGMADQTQDCYDRKFIKGVEDKWQPDDTSRGGYWKGGKHWSEVLADDAQEFIAEASVEKKPFFMYLAFNAPHDPRQSPREFLNMYPVDNIKLPKSFMPEYPYAESIGCGKTLRDEMLAPFPRTSYSIQKSRQEYYALITHMDAQIGKIINALKQSGKWDNTYIIFTADHGLSVGDHGFMGKQNLYDMSLRTPLLIAGPGIKKGSTYNDMIYIQDLAPTSMDLAGCKNYNNDFKSFLPLLRGKKYEPRKSVYAAYIGLQRMVRTERYKMIIYPSINVVRLYDIKKDPNELKDLAGSKKYISVMKSMFKEFQKLQKEVEDPLDITPYFNKYLQNTFALN